MTDDKLLTIYKKFNHHIFELTNILADVLPNDPIVSTIQRGITISVMEDKSILLQNIGEELYKFGDEIADNQFDTLINRNWDEYINQSDSIEDAHRIFQTLKPIWSSYDQEEKNIIAMHIKHLLSEYSKYLVLTN